MIISSKRYLEVGNMYIAILTIGIIGLLLEEVVFATIEDWTVRRWGLMRTGG